MDNTVDEGGDKFQGGQFDTGYGTHDGRGNVNTHSREQPGLALHDQATATAEKISAAAGPTAPPNDAGYIGTDTGLTGGQAESWRSQRK